jgi:putative redox protein
MVPQSFVYRAGFRCEATHGPSKTRLITDAPTDNHGKGESFSPTDLVVTALSTCMITTMAIAVEPEGIQLDGTRIHAEKHMSSEPPRRIAMIVVNIDFAKGIPPGARSRLERVAHTCPVMRSISPEIKVELTFKYPD